MATVAHLSYCLALVKKYGSEFIKTRHFELKIHSPPRWTTGLSTRTKPPRSARSSSPKIPAKMLSMDRTLLSSSSSWLAIAVHATTEIEATMQEKEYKIVYGCLIGVTSAAAFARWRVDYAEVSTALTRWRLRLPFTAARAVHVVSVTASFFVQPRREDLL